MNIYEKLMNITSELKAPKSKFNSFGKYSYRSCEDILEAVKPICKKYGAVLTITDDIRQIGDRFYVEAKATLIDVVDLGSISTTALAREDMEKKGMDAAQVTGSASSYARKYALNGLMCIDDNKDADTDEYHNQTTAKPAEKKPAAKAEPKKESTAPATGLVCDACGKSISAQNPTAWKNKSHLLYAKCLCLDCMNSGKFPKVIVEK